VERGRTGRARLEVGGKYGRDIVFRGNRRYLPARTSSARLRQAVRFVCFGHYVHPANFVCIKCPSAA